MVSCRRARVRSPTRLHERRRCPASAAAVYRCSYLTYTQHACARVRMSATVAPPLLRPAYSVAHKPRQCRFALSLQIKVPFYGSYTEVDPAIVAEQARRAPYSAYLRTNIHSVPPT
jgi:hypothetical protein